MVPALLQCLGMSHRMASGQGVGRAPPPTTAFRGQTLSSKRTGTALHCLSPLILFLFGGLWGFCSFFFNCPQIRKKHERLCPNGGLNPGPKAGCRLALHVRPRPPFSPALCPAVDYVIFLIRPFSNASVSTSPLCPALPISVFKAFEAQ